MKNKGSITVMVLAAVFFLAGSAAAGELSREADGWVWKENSGERLKNQFKTIDGERYYFDSRGLLVTGRFCSVDEELYFFDENGRCARNLWKYAEGSGEGVGAGAEAGTGAWYFFTSSGKAFRNGWISIDEKRYHFSEWKMDHGWYLEEDENGTESVYYLGGENEGAAASGWVAWKGGDVPGADNREIGWYYFKPGNFRMVSNREEEIDGCRYAFNEDGRMAAGFVSVNGKEKYYDPATGRQAEGWFYLEESAYNAPYHEGWYYFNSGQALKAGKGTAMLAEYCGTAEIDGRFYGFDHNGKMLTGVVLAESGKYYCFGKDGELLTGRVNVSDLETTGCTAGSLPAEEMLFGAEGSAPPTLGASYSGEEGAFVYRNGVKLRAIHDTFETVETETSLGVRSFVVDQDGKLRKNGTVKLKNGESRKVIREDGSYHLE